MAHDVMQPVRKMLFVDDRSKRIHAALEKYRGWDITIAPNFFEAMRLLSSQVYDVVSLDHDLNGCDFEDPDSPTCGMEIVRYLAKTGWPTGRYKPEFIIHSKNLFAAHLMVTALNQMGFHAYYQPFDYEKKEHMKYDGKGIPLP